MPSAMAAVQNIPPCATGAAAGQGTLVAKCVAAAAAADPSRARHAARMRCMAFWKGRGGGGDDGVATAVPPCLRVGRG